jgi:hypothetical protein
MSWNIYRSGTVSGVKQAVAEAKPAMEVDRIAFERAKTFILDEVDRVTTNGVSVEASGHADRTNKIVVTDLPLAL